MISSAIDLKSSLNKFFGFDSFKGEQEKVIANLLNGNNTFVIMPTGGGKSLCYQLPSPAPPRACSWSAWASRPRGTPARRRTDA